MMRIRQLLVAVVLALVLAPPAAADHRASEDYQADAAHSGRLWGAGVQPPLHFALSVP
jgi:hypothetical protein